MEDIIFNDVRRHFPAAMKQVYLESQSTGLIPDYIYESIKKYQYERYTIGGDSMWDGHDTFVMIDEAKEKLGRMIDCSKTDIFFGLNSSHVYSVIAEGMTFKAGDNIIMTDNGWIGNKFAWQLRARDGVEIKYVKTKNGEFRPDDIEKLIDKKTKAVCLSAVNSITGFRPDLEVIGDICSESEIYFLVDGVQAIGIMPLDVKKMKIDFLAGNNYKWMLGYSGVGFAYINPDMRERIRCAGAGWMTDENRGEDVDSNLKLRNDAGMYELGYPDVAGIYGLGKVADMYMKIGGDNIKDYVLKLVSYLEEKITEIKGVNIPYKFKPDNKSQIVNILTDEKCLTSENMKREGIAVQIKPLDKGRQKIRLGLHYYNTKYDLDRFIDSMRKYVN